MLSPLSNRSISILSIRSCLLFAILAAGLPSRAADVVVYDEALSAGWENWSFGVTIDFTSATPVHAGTKAMKTTFTAGYSGIKLHVDPTLNAAQFTSLSFWIHGGAGVQNLVVYFYDGADAIVGSGVPLSVPANAWQQVTLTMAQLGSPADISSISWFANSPNVQPAFSLDEVKLIGAVGPTPTPIPGGSLTVNAAAGQHAISPYIYGVNFATEAFADEINLPVRRWGGNLTSRYNWQNDTANHASDYYFQNIPEDNANPGQLPNGSATDRFVEQDLRTGTKSLITIPMIGWVSKSRGFDCAFSIAKYGAQTGFEPFHPDCGNGISAATGLPIMGNDPTDTSIATTPAFMQAWIEHLKGRYGTAAQGGVAFYGLDNEPGIWSATPFVFGTHRDVHPTLLSYNEIRDLTYAYAAAIKASDPTAKTLGPVEDGWLRYLYSALDAAPGDGFIANPLDRNAHGGIPYVEWYLQQMQVYETNNGVRILDYFDLHNYPQAGGVPLSAAGSAATQALRLRSTRSLWDPTYNDESWISQYDGPKQVRLIPRMREWVANNYPGTKIAISEYNWGGLEHINGAVTQADILGIFGREGLDLATLWNDPFHIPAAFETLPCAYAFRLYRNYNGAGGAFGETGVQATSADQSMLSVYAAARAGDGALTIVVINKTTTDKTSALALSSFNPAPEAAVYRYSAANLGAIVHLANQPVTASGFSMTYPTASITMVVLSPSGGINYRALGDFDSSGCTDLNDFLFMLDNWQTVFQGTVVGVEDFLNLLDHWRTGAAC